MRFFSQASLWSRFLNREPHCHEAASPGSRNFSFCEHVPLVIPAGGFRSLIFKMSEERNKGKEEVKMWKKKVDLLLWVQVSQDAHYRLHTGNRCRCFFFPEHTFKCKLSVATHTVCMDAHIHIHTHTQKKELPLLSSKSIAPCSPLTSPLPAHLINTHLKLLPELSSFFLHSSSMINSFPLLCSSCDVHKRLNESIDKMWTLLNSEYKCKPWLTDILTQFYFSSILLQGDHLKYYCKMYFF